MRKKKLIMLIVLFISIGTAYNVSYAQSPERWKQSIKENNSNWKWLKNIGNTIFTPEDDDWVDLFYSYNRKIPWVASIDLFSEVGLGGSLVIGSNTIFRENEVKIIFGDQEDIDIHEDNFFFVALVPCYKFKYMSFGCGLGIARTEYSNLESKFSFMLRPEFKVYIPLGYSMYIAVGIGYDYSFKYTYYNGVNFGIGIGLPFGS